MRLVHGASFRGGLGADRCHVKTDGPGGTITGGEEPYMPGHNTYTGMSTEVDEEPEVVK